MVNLGEPADLLRVYGRRCVARWLWPAPHQSADQHAACGWIGDGRWWADTSVAGPGGGRGGRLFPTGDDASARAYVLAMMARHAPVAEWVEVIAEYEPGVLPGRAAVVPPYPPSDPRACDGR